MASTNLSPSAQRVQDALKAFGLECAVLELPASTRTAREAAQAVGCQVGQIVKSLVFKGRNTQSPILIVASGSNRVNEKGIAEMLCEPVEKADPDFVRVRTGFAIGGIPPVGHLEPLKTFIDEDLMAYQEIWAAAGTPHAVFKLSPADLQMITKGQVISIK
ncbi:MAG: YbaK/EbsC family protein [Acidobacteriia bacterium]|nr:YbaK/EbsC family protein [Terriglobia bacterium]